MSDEFDYDLNIFQRELLNAEDEYEYGGPWYIHIYQVNAYQGATVHEELGEPIELTEAEANSLITNDPYFDGEPDTWYGLAGFITEKHALISNRLTAIFDALPKYKEEVLFN
jgi:hypothetical protein